MISGRKILLAPLDPEKIGSKTSLSKSFAPEVRYCIILKETEEIVGQLNYCSYSPDEKEVEVGIEVDYADRGKGYGEDALYHFLDHLFSTMQVQRVKLAVVTKNLLAQRLYKKLGFRELELVKDGGYDVETETLVDVMMMELQSERWFVQRQNYSFKVDGKVLRD